MRKMTLLAALLLLPAFAAADGMALGAHAGLMGTGVDAFYRLNDNVVLHGAYNRLDYSFSHTRDGQDYDATVNFNNGQLGVDWYPLAGNFRLAVAYVMNGNEVAAQAIPRDGFFTVNGNKYPSVFVDDVRGRISYSGSAAYAGLGWGNPVQAGRKLSFSVDAGVVYTGHTGISTSITCAAVTPAPQCAQLKSDAEAQRRRTEDDFNTVPFWPLLQLGLGYQF